MIAASCKLSFWLPFSRSHNSSFMPRFSTMSFKINSDIGERQMLPWQMKRIATGVSCIFIIVLFLLVLSRNALPRLSSRSRQSQNARLCKHIGTLRSLLRVFCNGFWDSCSLLWNYRLWQIRAELSKLLLPVSSKIGSKTKILTTKNQSDIFFIPNQLINQIFFQFYFMNLRKRIIINRGNNYLIFTKITL